MKDDSYIECQLMQVKVYCFLFGVAFLMTYCDHVLAQSGPDEDYPIIGKIIPSFEFKNVAHYSRTTVTQDSFRGKWLIMDFWTMNCAACVRGFPKLNQLRSELNEHVQILLVGNNNRYNSGIQGMYEKFRQRLDLQLAAAYDSGIFEQFRIRTVPYVVIVNPEGIVFATINGVDLKKDDILDLIKLKRPPVITTVTEERNKEFEVEWSTLTKGNNSPTFLHRSVLSKWGGEYPLISNRIDLHIDAAYYQSTKISLSRLYNIAYLGITDWSFGDSLYNHFWRYPVFEISSGEDSLEDKERELFNYSLKVPKEKCSVAYLQYEMRSDLKKYFGYEVSIERRSLPFWRLVASKGAINKLRSKGAKGAYQGNHAGIRLSNTSIRSLLKIIWSYHINELPFLDETGINENIDIHLDSLMTDLDEIRRSLNENGLDLILGHKEFNVLVVRECKMQ